MWRPSPRSASASDSFAAGVGGHQRGRGAQAGVAIRRPSSAHSARDARLDRRHRHRDPDEPGRAHEHVAGRRRRCPRAVSSHMRRASARPASPVAALALPEFSTTAAARPSARWARVTCTGAAWARLVVNTPAAVTGTPVGGRDQREVGVARRLDPRRDPRGLEPLDGGHAHGWAPISVVATGRAHGIIPTAGRPVVSGSPRTRLQRLHGLPGRALDQVVDRAHREDGAGARVEAHGDLRGVGAQRRLGLGRVVGHDDERLAGVVLAVAIEEARRWSGRRPRGGRRRWRGSPGSSGPGGA